MFYGNPAINKNIKKKHHNFPLLATVGLVFGGSPSGRLFGDLASSRKLSTPTRDSVVKVVGSFHVMVP